MHKFFFLLSLLIILPTLYCLGVILKKQGHALRRRLALLLLVPNVVAAALMAALIAGANHQWLFKSLFYILICWTVPTTLWAATHAVGLALWWLTRRLVLRPLSTPSRTASRLLPARRAPLTLHRAAWMVALVAFGVQLIGATWGWRQLRVKRTDITVSELPAGFDGFRIVQLSDLHIGTFGNDTSMVASVVDSALSLRPDLIVFTGDMVNTLPEELTPAMRRTLARLSAPHGVVAILGNHDYCIYGGASTRQEVERAAQRIVGLERLMGWTVLLNDNLPIVCAGDTLYVAGTHYKGKPHHPWLKGDGRGDETRDDTTRTPYRPRWGNLEAALSGIPPHHCTLLLSHDPWIWRAEVVGRHDVALTLSGHTHALQLQLGSFSPAAWFMPEWGGLYAEGNSRLYVSTGVGANVPYRLGAWPSLDLLILHR